MNKEGFEVRQEVDRRPWRCSQHLIEATTLNIQRRIGTVLSILDNNNNKSIYYFYYVLQNYIYILNKSAIGFLL